MKTWKKVTVIVVTILILALIIGFYLFSTRDSREPSFVAWNKHCSSCHGADMDGSAEGLGLLAAKLKFGDTIPELIDVIRKGVDGSQMPGYASKLDPTLIKALALYISERRQRFPTTRDSYRKTDLNDRIVQSHHHDFHLERIVELESRPYSVVHMPDETLLVAEKTRGLSLVDTEGVQSPVIVGTPRVWDAALRFEGSWLNWGTVLDVALHPNYAENGWIYLSHTDRCQLSCGWPLPATMVRVVRGRIKDGTWVDQEIIWSVHKDHYTPVPDAVAAGRLAFDGEGHVYVSIGGKNTYSKLHDLNTPYGKVHRVKDEGSIPTDNPFYEPEEDRPESSTIHTVWSYGHRTGQGLDGHPVSGEIWNTEMGPRGGDEVNRIQGGKNYGWPLFTNGLDYNGEEVSIGKDLGLDFKLADTVLPVVDFTPAPAISNFTFHNGNAFSAWADDLLIGTLKAKTLYRVRLSGDEVLETEKLITDFGRIRDVTMGGDGFIYLAIEHDENGSLWRLRPRT
ncbi:MAG: PQQ-dependent sugar dehydrogenase [Pseudomonadota bacterium]